jgi:hypothetical protein
MPLKQNMPICSVMCFQGSGLPRSSRFRRSSVRMLMMRSAMPRTSSYHLQQHLPSHHPSAMACTGWWDPHGGVAAAFVCLWCALPRPVSFSITCKCHVKEGHDQALGTMKRIFRET